MLRALRDGAKSGFLKFILLGFMGMAVGGLVLMDVGGFFRGGTTARDVAKVGSQTIGVNEFDRTVRRVLEAQGIGAQEAYRLGFINAILRAEIQNRVIYQEAKSLGIYIDDAMILQQVNRLAEPLVNEETSKKQAIQYIMRSQGFATEGQFVQAIRREMTNSLLRGNIALATAALPDIVAQDLYAHDNETRDIEAFVLKRNAVQDIETPTEEGLKGFYDLIRADFIVPEERAFTLATLKKEMLENTVEVSEEELKELYQDNIRAYQLPERRVLQQAVFLTQKDADDVLIKTQGGKSLKKAVRFITGGEDAYLGEDEFERDGLLPEIANPVFAANKDAILGPIQTALGWHVMVLTDILPEETLGFEKVKEELEDEVLQVRLLDELIGVANVIDDRIASGEDLESVVSDLGLTKETLGPVRITGLTSSAEDLFKGYGFDKGEILDLGFELEEAEISPVLELADGRFVVIRVDQVIPQTFKSYDIVKDEVKNRWIAQQKTLKNQMRARDALASLQAGAEIKTIAKDLGVTIQKFQSVSRKETPKEPLTPSALTSFFNLSQGEFALANLRDGVMIGTVNAISLPPAKQAKAEDLDAIREAALRSLPEETAQQYLVSLQDKYRLKINEAVLKRLYGESTQ